MPEISYPPTKSRFLFFHLLAPLLSKEPSSTRQRLSKDTVKQEPLTLIAQGQTP